MSNWGLPLGGNGTDTFGIITATSLGTVVTSDSSAHTMGAYVEFVAVTSFELAEITVCGVNNSSTSSIMVDVAVGASGQEKNILTKVFMHVKSNSGQGSLPWVMRFPITVAVGSRISVRMQSSTSGPDTALIALFGARTSFWSARASKILSYSDEAITSGFTVVPDTTANTKGVWKELVASTADPIIGLIIAFSDPNSTNSNQKQLCDIGIGAAAAEKIVIANLATVVSSTLDASFGMYYFPMQIPAGTRIAARGQSTLATDGDRLFDINVLGIVA